LYIEGGWRLRSEVIVPIRLETREFNLLLHILYAVLAWRQFLIFRFRMRLFHEDYNY
jgi:hypothetical protein